MRTLALVSGLLFTLAGTASAEPVRLLFGGTITDVYDTSVFGDVAGERLSGFVSFDPDAASRQPGGTAPPGGEAGIWLDPDGVALFTIGSIAFGQTPLLIAVGDNVIATEAGEIGDSWQIPLFPAEPNPRDLLLGVLVSGPADTIDSADLIVPTLERFPYGRILVREDLGSRLERVLAGSIDTLIVPEPRAGLMLAITALAVASRRRRS